MTTSATIALVGDRSPTVRAHGRIPLVIDALRRREGLVLDPYWIPSTEADDLERFDGIWVVPGSPYRDMEKVIAAVGTARAHGVPFLGTCGGFQHAIIHLARALAGIGAANHAEYGQTDTDVIVPLECSLVGHEGIIRYTPNTRIASIAGVDQRLERYHCSYGIAPAFVERLELAGVVFGAHDEDGAPRALELPGHAFFLGTLFQPELAGDGTRAHPVIRAFAEAVVSHRGSRIAPPWPTGALHSERTRVGSNG
jgi:CTP synthase (UTP-ammonia lyase)